MAPIANELATLRALTYRIQSTPTPQLPQHVPAIAASLATCKTLLSSPASSSKTASDASVAVHKYRTQLSTLLQDRTFQGRWAAVVLVKATIEVGGWETLSNSKPWVQGLLGILTKPDPFSSKQLCIITLTRIFTLTRDYPTLLREFTTPSLTPFIQSTLQIATSKTSPALLETILESYNQLLPRHPTTFRSYLKQIQPLLNQLIAPTPSSKLGPEQVPGGRLHVTRATSQAAQRLYTQLPCSAPNAAKGAASEEWQTSFKKTVENAHHVLDKVYRAVVEDWKPSTRDASHANGDTLDDEVQERAADTMSLPPWSGIFAGGERLIGLLGLVNSYLLCPTTLPVNINLGVLLDLLTRLLSLTIPAGKSQGFNAVRFNNQVSKEERENLWLLLPKIHVATIEILLSLMQRTDSSSISIDAGMLDQLVWVFNAEKDIPEVRTAIYLGVVKILRRSGLALPKSSVDSLGGLLRQCCEDLLPQETSTTASKNAATQTKANGGAQATTNADAFLSLTKAKGLSANYTGLQSAAHILLRDLFAHVRPQFLADSLRARIDRTAILIDDKDTMVASVLNPPPSTKFGKPSASILPLLARSRSGEQDVEALIRPRMPVIFTGGRETDDIEEEDEEEDQDEEDEEDEEPEKMEEEDQFVGNELDSLLGTAVDGRDAGGDITMAGADHQAAAAIGTRANSQAAENLERANAASKRPQEDATPLSPSKRVKASEGQREKPQFRSAVAAGPEAVPVTIAAPTLETPAVVPALPVPASDVAPATSTLSTIPPVPRKDDEEEDSDDDDDGKISLVLGQDTDSDSE